VVAIKVYQSHLYSLYGDPNTCYVYDAFKGFKDLVASKHDTIGLCWVVKALALDITDSRVEYLTIYIANHTFLAIYVDPFFENFN
jgi:hypothetical protein